MVVGGLGDGVGIDSIISSYSSTLFTLVLYRLVLSV